MGEENERTKGKEFYDAFTYGMMKVSILARVGKLGAILPDKKATKSTEFIHEYIGAYVRKTVQHTIAGTAKMNPNRYIFLEHLAHAGYSERKIRDELLNILLAGRDTTAGLLAHLWYVLARRPDVFNKLRTEVLKHGEEQPTFESIKEMKYLQYCLNESRFLYPGLKTILIVQLSDSIPLFQPTRGWLWSTLFSQSAEDRMGNVQSLYLPGH